MINRQPERTLSHRLWPLLVVFLAPACGVLGGGSEPEVAPPTAPSFAGVPERARLFYDDAGGIPDSLRLVIKSDGEWEDVWYRATDRRASRPSIPEVDFTSEMVLVVAAGRMVVGDQIRVDSIGVWQEPTMDGGTEQVLTVLVRTIRGCAQIERDVWPLEIVQVQRFEGRVTWIDKSGRDPDC
jgi:hypothetical protein